MPRRPGIQILRRPRTDGSITYSLRVRTSGADEAVSLGNSTEGWDEVRVERARQQLLAKIELGLWSPRSPGSATRGHEEPTFAELATEWLTDRERNPAIRPRTIEDDRWRLTRDLIPFFGEILPSEISPTTIKQYRRRIHEENAHIRAARGAKRPLQDSRTGKPLTKLSNDSINKTLRTLAAILDEAEDPGWITRNVARGRRTRKPIERRSADAVAPDQFAALLEAAGQLDSQRHKPETLVRARMFNSSATRDGSRGRRSPIAPGHCRRPRSTCTSARPKRPNRRGRAAR
jgi:hypothetical protein